MDTLGDYLSYLNHRYQIPPIELELFERSFRIGLPNSGRYPLRCDIHYWPDKGNNKKIARLTDFNISLTKEF
jgi:hypothetical protein